MNTIFNILKSSFKETFSFAKYIFTTFKVSSFGIPLISMILLVLFCKLLSFFFLYNFNFLFLIVVSMTIALFLTLFAVFTITFTEKYSKTTLSKIAQISVFVMYFSLFLCVFLLAIGRVNFDPLQTEMKKEHGKEYTSCVEKRLIAAEALSIPPEVVQMFCLHLSFEGEIYLFMNQEIKRAVNLPPQMWEDFLLCAKENPGNKTGKMCLKNKKKSFVEDSVRIL